MNGRRYVGRAWRSRFLRAPKAAVRFATREDFTPLGALAKVRLGLKTGNDGFFYVRPLERVPHTVRLGSPRARATVAVRGLRGRWEGELSAADLRPAALNPHVLIRPHGRLLAVPARPEVLYLYPQNRPPAADLAEYVAAGVQQGVHQGQLVRQNAAPGGPWYRQARGVVAARWALPYNSAYDYGAHDNQVGAVLNGRFVGVDPLEGVDEDLLGAALNSTFVAATRLLEGVSTGAEGAYDVGPPAARLMAIPDVRRMSGAGVERVREALDTLHQADLIPPEPDRRAAAHPSRHALDVAVLVALGMGVGEAQYLTGKLYESYARWRGAVEDAETIMREYRRAMGASGQGRGTSPTTLAARRVRDELAAMTPLLPGAALRPEDELEEVDVAGSFSLPDQEPLVDPGRVPTVVGKETDLGSFARVRYVAMLLKIGFAPPLSIPKDHGAAARVVDTFDRALDAFRSAALEKARAYVGGGRAEDVVQGAERLWLGDCRAYGMRPPSSPAPGGREEPD